jgi:hypothetical protein
MGLDKGGEGVVIYGLPKENKTTTAKNRLF